MYKGEEEIDHNLGVLSAVCLGDSHIVGDSHQPNSTVGFDSSLHETNETYLQMDDSGIHA